MYYYSPSSNGFYNSNINKTIPTDSVLLSEDQYKQFLHGLNNGKIIEIVDNLPRLVDAPNPVTTWAAVRARRNSLLRRSDYTQLADYPGNKEDWTNYRQALRDIPQVYSNPQEVIWPEQPK